MQLLRRLSKSVRASPKAPTSTSASPEQAPILLALKPSLDSHTVGVSLARLTRLVRDAGDDAQDWTVHEFCEKCVKVLTSASKSSLAEYWAVNEPESVKAVADAFISYAWSYTMADLLAALNADAATDRFVWIDFACVNQHVSSTVSKEEWKSKFETALKTIGRAELVLIPYSRPVTTTRVWCAFETSILVQESIAWKARLLPREREEFRERMTKIMSKGSAFFHSVFANINVLEAQASKSEDREMILEFIHRVGPAKVNEAAMSTIKSFLTEEALNIASELKGQAERREAYLFVCGNLGSLYVALGQPRAGLPWFEQAVELSRAHFGEDDMNTALWRHNLGACYVALGRYEDALACFERCLSLPDEAKILNSMGACQYHLGNTLRALELYQKSLSLREVQLGKDHIDTASSLNSVGGCLMALKRNEEARACFERAVSVRQTVLGDSHPLYAESLNNLAACLKALGRVQDALEMHQRAHDLREIILGDRHPAFADSVNNVAACHQELLKYEDALIWYRKALEIRRNALGESHVKTLDSMHNLACCLLDADKDDEARALGRAALSLAERDHGRDSRVAKELREDWGE